MNLGDADDLIVSSTIKRNLPITQSKTGTAFYQTQRVKCFDLPTTNEIWIKFDVYFNGSNRWRAFNGGANSSAGISSWGSTELDFVSNGSFVRESDFPLVSNTLQTILLHMISGSSNGIIEAWVDGEKIYTYTGDVNHGEDFADIYLQSDGSGTFFSNVIISNVELTQGDGWQEISADTERRIKNIVEVTADVERKVKNIIAVEFVADVERKFRFATSLSADVARKVIRSVSLDFDVEILDVIPVEFVADVTRNILAKMTLYPIDSSAYFSGGGSAPIVIPTQNVVPPAINNEATCQSIEISLSEQQLTEQVTSVTVIPFDILFPVQGQYLDYIYDMRVEKVQRQGILYTVNCCSDIDEILYTPLNYDLPVTLSVQTTSSDTQQPKYITATLPVEASKHVEKFAAALGLQPVIQFEDFYSSVEVPVAKTGGATYSDLIRDIFGWSSRIPTQLINAYIRNGKLFVIQRGYESNIIDISDADKTLPVVTHELIRLFYQRQKFSKTYVSETKRRKVNSTAHSSEIDSGSPDSGYEYDNDGLLKKTVTTTTTSDGDESKTITKYKYNTLPSGKKVLVKETTEKYVNDVLEETTEIKHTPLKQGLSHQVKTDEDGNILAEGVGQNSSDDRVTPYEQFENVNDDYETVTHETTIDGLTLFDTSFPIQTQVEIDDSHWEGAWSAEIVDAMQSIDNAKGLERLKAITKEIKRLNRKTQETVTLSIYNFPHLIDFNDRIILNGVEYFLVSNSAKSTQRIFNEQNLTLRRWY